ncbi:TPA: hypothetical protein N0F65_008919 [Lagenidium giganteum]|uniref:Uncharacterized protein n=1 Tax=Lagenidium giganteum TaxID=4803 RepID=A0AAV2YUE5_9STRA|nr:TPA: hypothetical protein N0F65_008919 [Lagenidium giganteum]
MFFSLTIKPSKKLTIDTTMQWLNATLSKASKLQALIQKESLDEASADSLANLFAQVMAKNREYDYDQITKKLTKGVFKPVKKNETIGDVYSLMGDDTSTKSKKPNVKINTFVPQVTDTDITMTTPPRES